MNGDKQRRCTNFECIHPANFPVAECSCDLTTGMSHRWIYTGKAYDEDGYETDICDECAWTSRWPWPTVHSVVYPTDSRKLARG